MNKILSKVPNLIVLGLTGMAFLFAVVACGPLGGAFQGGIRMAAYAETVIITVNTVPVPGIPDEGSVQSIDGPGPGSTTLFSGETNDFGIDDITDARTNAHWATDENWARFPGCFFTPPGSAGFCFFPNNFVPAPPPSPGGAIFTCVCQF